MTKLRHYDHLDTSRFVTFSCYRRLTLLGQEAVRDLIVSHLKVFRKRTGIMILGYVIMPEHVHLVLYPPKGISLGVEIGKLKGSASRDLTKIVDEVPKRLLRDGTETKQVAIWHRRCYDHNCRTRETTIEKIEYCHNNPVKRGLISDPSGWRWSSYRWYNGFDDAILEVDGID